jgi:hypothetical protein
MDTNGTQARDQLDGWFTRVNACRHKTLAVRTMRGLGTAGHGGWRSRSGPDRDQADGTVPNDPGGPGSDGARRRRFSGGQSEGEPMQGRARHGTAVVAGVLVSTRAGSDIGDARVTPDVPEGFPALPGVASTRPTTRRGPPGATPRAASAPRTTTTCARSRPRGIGSRGSDVDADPGALMLLHEMILKPRNRTVPSGHF